MAVLLLLLGTLAGSAAGRVFHQMALTATKDDNGYVTMFFLPIPALSSLTSFMVSRWIPGLRFVPSAMFFAGTALVTVALFLLSVTTWPRNPRLALELVSFVAAGLPVIAAPLDQSPSERAARRLAFARRVATHLDCGRDFSGCGRLAYYAMKTHISAASRRIVKETVINLSAGVSVGTALIGGRRWCPGTKG